jgi:ribonuclease I
LDALVDAPANQEAEMRDPAARETRLARDYRGWTPSAAGLDWCVFNLSWSPRAGNLSDETRAGKSGR